MKSIIESILVMVFLILISTTSFGCPSQGDDPVAYSRYEKSCPYGDAVLVFSSDKDIVEDSMCITYDAGKQAFMSFDYDWKKGTKVYPPKEYPIKQWQAYNMDGELLPMGNGKIKVYPEPVTYVSPEVLQREADMKVANMYDEHWK